MKTLILKILTIIIMELYIFFLGKDLYFFININDY